MNIKDNVNLRGEVLITGVDSTTGLVTTFVNDRNLIVLNGRQKLANALFDNTGYSITGIVLGSGGTASNNPTLPYAVDPSELTVKTPILMTGTPFTLIPDRTASPKLTYTLIIPETSFNGSSINELALMLSDNTAFAIKRFSTITKSSSLSLKIVWTIYL